MDAKRIELLRKHLASADSSNVSLHARDLCELVTESQIDDEGLQKAAASMQGHVGKVVIERAKAAAMLDAVGRTPNVQRPTSKDEKADKSK